MALVPEQGRSADQGLWGSCDRLLLHVVRNTFQEYFTQCTANTFLGTVLISGFDVGVCNILYHSVEYKYHSVEYNSSGVVCRRITQASEAIFQDHDILACHCTPCNFFAYGVLVYKYYQLAELHLDGQPGNGFRRLFCHKIMLWSHCFTLQLAGQLFNNKKQTGQFNQNVSDWIAVGGGGCINQPKY